MIPMQKPANITKHEVIGLDAEVVESKNKSESGIRGTITDETRNMLVIKTPDGEKKVSKKNAKFMFAFPDNRKVVVEGNLLVGKPESRIQKRMINKRV